MDKQKESKNYSIGFLLLGLIFGIILSFPLSIYSSVDKHLYTNQQDYPILQNLPQALEAYIQTEKSEPKSIKDLYPKYIDKLPYSVSTNKHYGVLDVQLGRPWEGLDGPEKLTIMFKDKYGFFGDSYTQIDYKHEKKMYLPRDQENTDVETNYIERFIKTDPLPYLPGIIIIFIVLAAISHKKPRVFSLVIGTCLSSVSMCYSFLFV